MIISSFRYVNAPLPRATDCYMYEYERHSYTKGEHAGVSHACSKRRVGKLRNRPTGLHAPSPRPEARWRQADLSARHRSGRSLTLLRPIAGRSTIRSSFLIIGIIKEIFPELHITNVKRVATNLIRRFYDTRL